MNALILDNRKSTQPDRHKYLPSTFFLPDLVVDFQHLITVSKNDLESYSVVAMLDSPYAEALLTRFSRYYGRLGTIDIDKSVVYNRLKEGLPKPLDPVVPPPNIPHQKK